jgi:hypothetical protein
MKNHICCPLGSKTLCRMSPNCEGLFPPKLSLRDYCDVVDCRPILKNAFVVSCFTSASTSTGEIMTRWTLVADGIIRGPWFLSILPMPIGLGGFSRTHTVRDERHYSCSKVDEWVPYIQVIWCSDMFGLAGCDIGKCALDNVRLRRSNPTLMKVVRVYWFRTKPSSTCQSLYRSPTL